MIKIENHIGKISVSESYLIQLIEKEVSNCFGVVGIYYSNPIKNIYSKMLNKDNDKGINIYLNSKNVIVVDLHIMVTFGTNVSAIVESVTHKIHFAIIEAIGNDFKCKVNVFIDGMNS